MEELKEHLSAVETMLSAIVGEAADTRATDVAAHAELAYELNSASLFVELFLDLEW